MKIAMIASESRPFCKTGGLADVVYSLGKELAVIGEKVMVIIPFYQAIKDSIKTPVQFVDSFVINMSWRHQEAKVYLTEADGISFYFIEHPYFDRNHIYGDGDDGERFAFFALAARELMFRQKDAPDIIHVHDWQAGMLPCLMKVDPFRLAKWIAEKSYPFAADDTSDERRRFDEGVAEMRAHLEGFDALPATERTYLFNLLKSSIATNH